MSQKSYIQWCEARTSARSAHAVEWYNSVSSLIFVVAGGIGLFRSARMQRSFLFTETMLVLVGFGSVYFHATATLLGEMADELPMALLAFGYVWELRGLHWLTRAPYEVPFYATNVVAVACAFTAYLASERHDLFVLLFTGQVCVAAFTTLAAARAMGAPTTWWWRFLFCILLGKAFWETERFLWRADACPEAGAAFFLHPLWHVLSCGAHVCCQAQMRALLGSARKQR